ncbi:MAG TPA: hypothetical protein VJ998_07000, partial [Pseudomonadales bacterium]|nr:hypothetical protein [Pseudomonadales bacterium]
INPVPEKPTMPTFDLLIRNGQIYDGSGAPPRKADIAIKDGLIVAIGEGLAGDAPVKSMPPARR